MNTYNDSPLDLEDSWKTAVDEQPENWTQFAPKTDPFHDDTWDTELRGIPEYDSPLAG